MNTPTPTEDRPTIAPAAHEALAIALHRLGWRLYDLSIDLPAGAARLTMNTAEGLYVTLDAHDGRATVTRERVRHTERARSGLRYTAGWDAHLIGRTHHEGIRSALRAVADYAQENAPRKATLTARAAFRSLLANGVPA